MIPILQIEKLRHIKVKYLAPNHTANKWKRWDSNVCHLFPKPWLKSACLPHELCHKFTITERKTDIIRNDMSKGSLALNVYNTLCCFICKGKITKWKNMNNRLEPFPLRLCLHGEIKQEFFNIFSFWEPSI